MFQIKDSMYDKTEKWMVLAFNLENRAVIQFDEGGRLVIFLSQRDQLIGINRK